MSIIKINIVANFAGRGWKALINVAFVPLYITLLGIEAYGLIGIFVTLTTLFTLVDLGLSTTLNRELAKLSVQRDSISEMRDFVRTIEIIYWILAIFSGCIIIFLAPMIASHWIKAGRMTHDVIRQSVMIMGLITAFNLPFAMYSGGLMGLQRQTLFNGIIIITETVRGIGAVLVLWLVSPTIKVFFLWQIFIATIQTFATAIALWMSLPRAKGSAHFRKDLLLRVWRFAAGLTGISVVVLILTQVDKIILSKMLTLEMFGYYTLAWTVAGGLYVLIGPVFNATFPCFSQYVALNDKNRLKEIYHKSCQLMSILILPAAIIIALFATEILNIWLQNPIMVERTHKLVTLLIIGSALNGLMNIPYALQLAYGWIRLSLYGNLIGIMLLVPMIVYLTHRYGAVGGAIAWPALNLGYFLLAIPIMHRRLLPTEKWRWYIEDVGKPLMAALLTASFGRFLISGPMSQHVILAYLFAVFIVTLLMSILVASHIRMSIIYKLQMAIRFPAGRANDNDKSKQL